MADPTTVTTFSEDVTKRIHQLTSTMPYAGGCGPIVGDIDTPEKLIRWLENLRGELQAHAEVVRRDDEELRRLQGLMAGGSAFLAELLGGGARG